ncbi:centrosomal protein CEP57L1 isoform X1 [Tachysurus fulvidraco]|uniref:centrosomal protein CEP57L1 isoform X1 n=2 Tax=Tachysurus fulvidraco TaxID=1234273 RepID=UPI000F50E9C7|nr:centrosomal protein CEP57L1 isoform X1 [Tachysurus fulvidraco]XP_047674173.1 centrosomal protein CEP57L1 isoform X1 [Tachysurus fulvidraco]
MDRLRDSSLCLDSPSKHSYIGSFYAPPDRMAHHDQDKSNRNLIRSSRSSHTTPDTGSRAVIAALKSLQEKMRRLELERLQAEKNVERFAQAARQCTDSGNQTSHQLRSRDGESSKRKELVSQLHSAEARCSLLEKQLEYMRKLVESAQREKTSPVDRDREEKKSKPTEPQIQAQLQKLEEECIKLTNTQSEAERKIKLLERRLLEEEHERKLVQEKAEELQRELETNLLFSAAEVKPKKKKKTKEKTTNKKSVNPEVPQRVTAKRMPFVAGTSTSPSYSVNANVQAVLHLLKTRQPRVCERTQSLNSAEPKRRSGSQRGSESQSDGAAAMGSLSDLLLALQDELGHMSFEHQELVRQIDETNKRELREDLERELDCLVRRMEEKAAQITKLRKHQQTVQKLAQCSPKPNPKPRRTASADRVQVAPSSSSVVKPSPSRPQRHQKASVDRLQLLRDAQKFQSSLRQQDISWET